MARGLFEKKRETREYILMHTHTQIQTHIYDYKYYFKNHPGVEVHTFNPSTLETETGRSLWVPGQPGLRGEREKKTHTWWSCSPSTGMLSSKVEGFKARLAVQELIPEHKNEQKHPNCRRGTRNGPMRGQKRILKKALGERCVCLL